MTEQATARAAALEDLLCFDLYAASRAVTALYRPLLDELGLTYPQYLVLALLQPDEIRPISSIARDLQLDHGTLTPLLRRLESAGLLSRTRSTADERVVQIALTADGIALKARFDELKCTIIDAMALPEPEARDLQRTLRRLTSSVATHGDGAPPVGRTS
ncbi:MAG: MarR family transcriptional regulator [Nakamurella sp.]